MKYKTEVLPIVLLLIALIWIPGCDSKSEISALQAERDSLQLKVDNLNQEYKSLQSENAEMSSQQAELEKENSGLTAENASLKTDMENVQAELSGANAANTTLQNDLNEQKARYNEVVANYLKTEQELNDYKKDIQQVYPAKLFATREALSAWLEANVSTGYDTDDPVMVYKYAAGLQQQALEDGYIISVNVSYIASGTTYYYRLYCTAQVQDNVLYYWDTLSKNPEVLIKDVTDFRWSTVY